MYKVNNLDFERTNGFDESLNTELWSTSGPIQSYKKSEKSKHQMMVKI